MMKKGVYKRILLKLEIDAALKVCKKKRNFRSDREYIERLIMDDMERLSEGGSTSSATIDTDRLLSLLVLNLEYSVVSKKLLSNILLMLHTQAILNPREKKSDEESIEEIQEVLQAAAEEFKKKLSVKKGVKA